MTYRKLPGNPAADPIPYRDTWMTPYTLTYTVQADTRFAAIAKAGSMLRTGVVLVGVGEVWRVANPNRKLWSVTLNVREEKP